MALLHCNIACKRSAVVTLAMTLYYVHQMALLHFRIVCINLFLSAYIFVSVGK